MGKCAEAVQEYHDTRIVLSPSKKKELTERGNSNRKRILDGLKAHGNPLGRFARQGSLKMNTLIQKLKEDYDLDDGLYFEEHQIKNMSCEIVKNMVSCAARHGSQVVVRNHPKCTRIKYRAQDVEYHIDVPVYKIMGERVELASEHGWLDSDPKKVTEWFDRSAKMKGAEETRRAVRLLKAFLDRKEFPKTVSGLVVSVLVCENTCTVTGPADEAFINVLECIAHRLKLQKDVMHPVIVNEKIAGVGDEVMEQFEEWVNNACNTLKISKACNTVEVLQKWEEVFLDSFFDEKRKFLEKCSDSISKGKVALTTSGVAITEEASGKLPRSWGAGK